ncbi:MAG: hypothetical protein RSF41_09240 [Lachnospiraceae bacterium]
MRKADKKKIVSPNLTAAYGEKVKAYLIKGARRLPGFSEWPNPQMGWGALLSITV